MRLLGVLFSAFLAFSCGKPVIVQTGTLAPVSGLPMALTKRLTQTWKGARVAAAPAPVASATACADGATRPGTLVPGDFNGDGIADLALQLSADDGTHLVLAIARLGDDFNLYDLANLGADAATVGVVPAGAPFHALDVGIDDYFGLDTLLVAPCGAAGTAYFWNGHGADARKVTLGASSQSAS